MASVVEFMPWTPGSPRLSFSRDFVQSEVFNPSSNSATTNNNNNESIDFDFGILSLMRARDIPPTTMLPADELFRNGRILPTNKVLVDQVNHPPHEEEEHDEQEFLNLKTPTKSSSNRWREIFRRRCSSETECSSSSSSSSCSARFSSAKLKLLFRSSSAGAGRSSPDTEPCLDRSASESKVSTNCCTRNLFHSAAADSCNVPEENRAFLPQKQPHKKTPSHRSAASFSGTANLGTSANSTATATASRVKRDAWRAYNERVISSGGAALPPNVKVAQVLHMEVCMGQSLVVSKVAKAFTKKENKSLVARSA